MRKEFLVWTRSLEAFFLEAILGERRDIKARFTRAILSGYSQFYHAVVTTRRWLIKP